jgi:hypothetical protein
LAARAPYFHNGSAATLSDLVEFYNQRFSIGLTDQQKSDLVAFSIHFNSPNRRLGKFPLSARWRGPPRLGEGPFTEPRADARPQQ